MPDGPKVYQGVEHGIVEIPLDDLLTDYTAATFPEAQKSGLYMLRLEKGKLVFAATNYIGLIPINDRISIDIRPKVPIHNLTRLLAKSGIAPTPFERLTRHYSFSEEEPVPQLLELFAQGFLTACEPIRQNGVLREYYNREEETSFPRGKIVFHSTIQRHASRNVSHRVTSSWFDRKVDNGPNRLLKYTIWSLAQHYRPLINSQKGAKKTLHSLNRAYELFDGVEIDHNRRFLQHHLVRLPQNFPSIRDYYRDVVNLAKAILTNRSVSFDNSGDQVLALPSLLVNLDQVFERYSRNLLSTYLSSNSSVVVQDGNDGVPNSAVKTLFDEPNSEKATPDIVIRESEGIHSRTLLIVEVKYKKLKESWPSREDLNQLITYSASFRSGYNILLYPAALNGPLGLHSLGSIEDVRYFAYFMNLGESNIVLEEEKLGSTVASLLNNIAISSEGMI